tara:strand:+ start:1728 stop:2369 length:642 start_codon:yes stop_codon:yes gene_type:complete
MDELLTAAKRAGQMTFTYQPVSGEQLTPWVEDLAKLRIKVFREYPYLYDGDLDYEKDYLATYLDSERSLVGLTFSNHKLVGATTCIPLADECDAFKKPFVRAGYDIDTIFYFGESIILPECRGQKTGHRFFEMREAHARKTLPGLRFTTFCAVDRGSDHPLKPHGYKPLDRFWTRMGYRKHKELATRFAWKDIDEDTEDEKTMVFWVKPWPQQ